MLKSRGLKGEKPKKKNERNESRIYLRRTKKKQCFSLSEIAIEISDIFVKRNKNELKLEKKT